MLTVTGDDAYSPMHRVEARFSFYALPHNPGVPSSAFTMHGHHANDTDDVVLMAGDWIERPDGYETVGLRGSLPREDAAGEMIRGNVDFPAGPGLCTVFEVRPDHALVATSALERTLRRPRRR